MSELENLQEELRDKAEELLRGLSHDALTYALAHPEIIAALASGETVAVPRKPTKGMILAGRVAETSGSGGSLLLSGSFSYAEAIYRAMLLAAPPSTKNEK